MDVEAHYSKYIVKNLQAGKQVIKIQGSNDYEDDNRKNNPFVVSQRHVDLCIFQVYLLTSDS